MNRRMFLRRAFTGVVILAAVVVPSSEKVISSGCQPLSNLKCKHFHILDAAQRRALEAIQREEDEAIFKALDALMATFKV